MEILKKIHHSHPAITQEMGQRAMRDIRDRFSLEKMGKEVTAHMERITNLKFSVSSVAVADEL